MENSESNNTLLDESSFDEERTASTSYFCELFLRVVVTIYIVLTLLLVSTLTCLSCLTIYMCCIPLLPFKSLYQRVVSSSCGFSINFWSKILLALCFFWQVDVLRDFPTLNYGPRRVIIMCNHLSNADGIILRGDLFRSAPASKVVLKGSLLRIPILGWAFWLAGDLPIHFKKDDEYLTSSDSVSNAMQQCKGQIEMGIPVVVFPEGTRSRHGRLQMFRNGFFKFAIENDCDIVPVVLHNSRTAWRPGSTLAAPAQISIAYGDVIPAQDHDTESLKLATRTAMIDLLNICPLYDNIKEAPFVSYEEQEKLTPKVKERTLL